MKLILGHFLILRTPPLFNTAITRRLSSHQHSKEEILAKFHHSDKQHKKIYIMFQFLSSFLLSKTIISYLAQACYLPQKS